MGEGWLSGKSYKDIDEAIGIVPVLFRGNKTKYLELVKLIKDDLLAGDGPESNRMIIFTAITELMIMSGRGKNDNTHSNYTMPTQHDPTPTTNETHYIVQYAKDIKLTPEKLDAEKELWRRRPIMMMITEKHPWEVSEPEKATGIEFVGGIENSKYYARGNARQITSDREIESFNDDTTEYLWLLPLKTNSTLDSISSVKVHKPTTNDQKEWEELFK